MARHPFINIDFFLGGLDIFELLCRILYCSRLSVNSTGLALTLRCQLIYFFFMFINVFFAVDSAVRPLQERAGVKRIRGCCWKRRRRE